MICWFCITAKPASAQCPSNIGFESGDFSGWTLYTGSVINAGGVNQIDLTQGNGASEHVMLSTFPGNGLDTFGLFPKNCPNGSGHSIRLGNPSTGAGAEGASYEFTIPSNMNQYTITYYYAVVFQNPNHQGYEQPRMEVEVLNMTDQTTLQCSSFTYVAGGGLPGFYPSNINPSVLCRDWSANSINLDNNAGKTFRLFFKTADCTLGGHFGYAYIDVDSHCGSVFPGAAYCAGDTSIDVKAPIGYQQYTWFQGSMIVGNQQALHMAPPPPAGTVLSVQVEPYPGYGCSSTFTVNITDDLVVTADAGPDRSICPGGTGSVQIGVPPTPGVIYQWTPTTGLNNPNISNPIASPGVTTQYVLHTSSPGAGCSDTDTVTVSRPSLNAAIQVTGNNNGFCEGSGQAILTVGAASSIQWNLNGNPISSANSTQYIAEIGGSYTATVSEGGCTVTSSPQQINIYPYPHAEFSVNDRTQCSPQDLFILTNTSTISSGTMQYNWDFGDGTISTETSPSHIYNFPGSYNIKLTASGQGGCADDTTISVLVKPGVDPQFSAKNVCVDLPVPLINNSNAPGATIVNYLWDFGNGATSTDPTPIYSYPTNGSYTITLTASTPQCPQLITKDTVVIVEFPTPAIRYPDVTAITNFPERLHARPIGVSALWTPSTNLDDPNRYEPYFKGLSDQLYTVQLSTKYGCTTIDTVFIKIMKKIAINVPTAFTPNGDGKNDLLRPVLFGFKKINYFKIYNRWGKLLFETEKENDGWNGMLNGTRQETQAVVWIIEAVDVDGVTHTEKGTVLLLR